MDTLPFTRQPSKETHTSLTYCCKMVPSPTPSLSYVNKHIKKLKHKHTLSIHGHILTVHPLYFLVQNGNTALGIARRLGYISVVDTLRVVTEEIITTTTVSHITSNIKFNPHSCSQIQVSS